jgi:hypothetical protein
VAAVALFLHCAYRDMPGSPKDIEDKHRQGYEDTPLEDDSSVGLAVGREVGTQDASLLSTVQVQPPASGVVGPTQRRGEGGGMGAVEMV